MQSAGILFIVRSVFMSVFVATVAGFANQVAANDDAARRVFGNDYPDYVAARSSQLRGAFADAVPLYRKLVSPLLRQAGDCYLAECLIAGALDDEAMEFYERWSVRQAASKDLEWYRGQMLLGWASLYCKRGQWDLSLSVLDQVLTWLDRAQPKVPDEWSVITDPGHACPDFVSPKSIVNGGTCGWYEPNLRVRALLLQGYARSQKGQGDGAVESIVAAGRLNRQYGLALVSDPDAIARLEWAAKNRVYLLPQKVWNQLASDHSARLRMGFFLYLAGETGQAQVIFDAVVAKGSKDPIPALDWAAAHLGQSVCRMRADDSAGAVAALTRFETLFRATDLGPLGRTILANVYSMDDRKIKDAIRIWGEIDRDAPGSEFGARALLAMAICAANQDDIATVTEAMDRLVKGHPTRHERFVAQRLIDEMRPSDNETASKVPAIKPRPGSAEFVTFKKISTTLQLPVRNVVSPSLDEMAGVDLIRYETTAVPIPETLGMAALRPRVTESEPSAPLLGTGPRTWFRAPVLINSTIRTNVL